MLAHSGRNLANVLNRVCYNDALRIAMRKLALIQAASRKGLKRRASELSDDELLSLSLGVPVHFLGNTNFKLGPIALTTLLTTNLFNPGQTAFGVNCTNVTEFAYLYVVMSHFQIVNKTASPATASLWIGGSEGNVAGTEFWVQGYFVPANNYISWYGRKRFAQADFLVGGAGTATALSLDGEGEIGVGA